MMEDVTFCFFLFGGSSQDQHHGQLDQSFDHKIDPIFSNSFSWVRMKESKKGRERERVNDGKKEEQIDHLHS